MPLFGPPNIEKLKKKRDILRLFKALQYRKSAPVRVAAAQALGEIGDDRALGPLKIALEDEVPDVRVAAAQVLGEIGDYRALRPLGIALEDEVPDVRVAAAQALGQLHDSKAKSLWALCKALRDEIPDVRVAAARALGRMGRLERSEAVKALCLAVHDEVAEVSTAAAQALGGSGHVRDLSRLSALLSARQIDDTIRIGAARALLLSPGRLGVQKLVDFLERGEKEHRGENSARDAFVRAPVAVMLGDVDDERAKQALIRAMASRCATVRMRAASKLMEVGTPEEKQALSQNLRGIRLDESGKSEAAIECFDEALAVFPGDGAVWDNKGLALLHLKRPEEAIVCFDKAIEAGGPQAHISMANKGSALLELRRFTDAESCYADALAGYKVETGDRYVRDRAGAPMLLGLGESLDGQGRTREAIGYYQQALALSPSAANVRKKLDAARRRLP